MIDRRNALKKNTVLKFTNSENGIMKYTILDEIGRGGSGIVYDAVYLNNAGTMKKVRIKECFPVKVKLCRESDGRLCAEADEGAFIREKERFTEAFALNNRLSAAEELTNITTNMVDLYEYNNTLYVVTAYAEGEVLGYDKERSIQDIIEITKSTAKAVGAVHDAGYLYLDIKPDNIFLYRETLQMIQLLDFDSVVKYGSGGCLQSGERLYFTKGFAAFELQSGHALRTGPWTDVYGIGALFFFLIFERTPEAPDCDEDAAYDYSTSIFEPEMYKDRLRLKIDDLLHKTIAGYYRDRYQSMDHVIKALDEMSPYAELTKTFVRGTAAGITETSLFGRERELEEIKNWWKSDASEHLLIIGIGGIGKSALARRFMAGCRREAENILYIPYDRALQRVIVNDDMVSVNTLQRAKEESEKEYYDRKLRALKLIGASGKNLMVIDNFYGEMTDELMQLSGLGWRMIVITRGARHKDVFRVMTLGPIEDDDAVKRMFEKHMERRIEEGEESAFGNITAKLKKHTLVLILLGKLIAKSRISLQEAEAVIEKTGFSEISAEKIDHIRDQKGFYGSIKNIIYNIFDFAYDLPEKRKILKVMTLFKFRTDISEIQRFLDLKTKDPVNALISEGWIEAEGRYISLHPIINEVADGWKWEREYLQAAAGIFRLITDDIRIYGHYEENIAKSGQSGNAGSIKELLRALNTAEQLLEKSVKTPELRRLAEHKELWYQTLMNMPYDREEFIVDNAGRLLKENISAKARATLHKKRTEVFLDQKNFHDALKELEKMRASARKDHYLLGLYYDAVSEFCDHKLDGNYEGILDMRTLELMNDSAGRAIYHMNKASDDPEHGDKYHYITQWMAEKAICMIRSGAEKKKEIDKYLKELKQSIDKYVRPYSRTSYTYNMCRAWYYLYVDPKPERIDYYLSRARDIAERIFACNIDIIDNVHIPFANIKLEAARIEGTSEQSIRRRAAEILSDGIDLCREKPDVEVYRRKECELMKHLREVYLWMGDEEKAADLAEELNKLRKMIRSYGHM